jgi:hypothetical protein
MVTFTAKRHPFRFYGLLFLFLAFMVGICFLLIHTYYNPKTNPKGSIKNELIPYLVVLFLIITIYLIYVYFRNCPLFKFDENGISFRGKNYLFSDMFEIELSGKQYFPMILYFPMECITLRFPGEERLMIFDQLYAESHIFKEILHKKFFGKELQNMDGLFPIEKIEADNDFYTTYKGNQLTNLRGVIVWAFIGNGVFQILKGNFFNPKGLIAYVILSMILFLSFSWTMHYFKVGQKYLIIKNHNLLWIHKTYRLDSIEEVVFETQGKLPYCLKIITKDFKRSPLFPAGTIREKTWLALKIDLENKGIKVRNECI